MLEITAKGRATVASQEFAEHISQMIEGYHQSGEREEDIEEYIRLRIAFALAEIDFTIIGPHPSEEERKEIAALMIANIDEIENAFDACIDMLKLHHHADRN